MRFLFNTVFYKPAKGGGGPIHSVSSFAEELVRRGHDVTVAASNRDIPGSIEVDTSLDHWIEGVRVRYFEARPTRLQRTGIPMFSRGGVFALGPEFLHWLNTASPGFDVVHSHISFTWSNSPCARYARKHRSLYFYHQRGNLDPVRLRRGFLKKWFYIALIEKPIMRCADALIALSQYEVWTYRTLGLANRIEVIPNGIDPGFGDGDCFAVGVELKKLFERLQGGIVFLFLSRIHPVKGPQLFAEAFARCASGNPAIHAILAGPDEVGRVEGILRFVRAAGVSDRFHYVGLVNGDDKLALLRRADAFVLPTASEGFSMAILEALNCGCAVLTSPGAHFEEIESAGAGLIVEARVQPLLRGMEKLVSRGQVGLKDMGRRGRQLVEDKYRWPAIVERYEHLCAELRDSSRIKG